MKEHTFKETYNIHELHRRERSQARFKLLSKEKSPSVNDSSFDPELRKEIEDLIIRPFVDQSLKDFIPTPLVTYENEYVRKSASARKTFQEYTKKIEDGMRALRNTTIWVKQDESHLVFKLPEDPKLYQKMLDAGKPLKEILSIPDEIMNLSYEEACKLYKNKDYVKTANILEVLLYLNPTPCIYWQLLGMAEQALGHIEPAAEILKIGLEKGSSSLIPYAHLINCLVDLKRPDEALRLIHTALSIEHPSDEHAPVIQQALRTLEQALTR